MLLFSGHAARQAMALLLGGGMALSGRITAQQLTSFYLYTDFVVAASLSVCDQWGSIMVRARTGYEFNVYCAKEAFTICWFTA